MHSLMMCSRFRNRITSPATILLAALVLFQSNDPSTIVLARKSENGRPISRNIMTNLKGGSTKLHRRRPATSSAFSVRKQEDSNVISSEFFWSPSQPSTSTTNDERRNEMQQQGASMMESIREVPQMMKEQRKPKLKIDASVALVFFCNAFAITLPVILTPMIAQSYGLSSNQMTSFCAAVASVGIMGGGMGKLINGMVCQNIGGVRAASSYLLGLGVCSLLLSVSTSLGSVRWLVAGMEFFSSAMWVACSMILSQHYSKSPISFARSITLLSLASTGGQLVAKLLGSVLMQFMNWRTLAQIGSGLTLCGALVVRSIVAGQVSHPQPSNNSPMPWSRPPQSLVDRLKSVVGSRLFWAVGFAHMSGYLARTCDRMFGPFLSQMTALPYSVCGGLTASATVGFAYGVMKSQSFHDLKSVEEKSQRLKSWYSQAGMSLLTFALLAQDSIRSLLSPHLMAGLLVASSTVLASSVAFQFFQIPNMVSSVSFADNQALCLAYIDGVGFFLTAPLWALSNRIVQKMGWSAAWTFLAMIFGATACLMVKTVNPVLKEQGR